MYPIVLYLVTCSEGGDWGEGRESQTIGLFLTQGRAREAAERVRALLDELGRDSCGVRVREVSVDVPTFDDHELTDEYAAELRAEHAAAQDAGNRLDERMAKWREEHPLEHGCLMGFQRSILGDLRKPTIFNVRDGEE